MEPFLGEIRAFAFGIIPGGWHLCDGATLQISQYQPLAALLGNRYGGDGRTTFQLPDLRGRVPLGCGVSSESVVYQVGNAGGSEGVVLTSGQIPSHTHTLCCSNAAAGTNAPSAAVPATAPTGVNAYADAVSPTISMAADAVASVGQSLAHNNMQPTLAVSFCIATTGIWPPRD